METVKLAPTLVPAAVLASKYQSEAHQIRRSMRLAGVASAAASRSGGCLCAVKLGDSARQRLVRIETSPPRRRSFRARWQSRRHRRL
jgi:HemY protein